MATMEPQLLFLLMVLASCLLPTWGCILCDSAVVKALRSLKNDHLHEHLRPEIHESVMKRVETALKDYKSLPIDGETYMGAIDKPTLKKVAWNFLADLKRLTDSEATGELFVKELFWLVHRHKNKFAKQSAQFLKESYCPNKCGLMLQTLIWCEACEKQVHACRKSKDCGEHTVKVHQMEDLLLDCELSWHRASEGLTNYSFYRVWNNNTETLLSKGKQSTLVKQMVVPEDAGTYRCELGTINNSPATIIHYHVTVLPQRITEETLPPVLNLGKTTINTTIPRTPNASKILRRHLIWLLLFGAVLVLSSIGTIIFFLRPSKKSQARLQKKLSDTVQETPLGSLQEKLLEKTPVRFPETAQEMPKEKSLERPQEKSLERAQEKSLERTQKKSLERAQKSLERAQKKSLERAQKSLERAQKKSLERAQKSLERAQKKSLERAQEKSLEKLEDSPELLSSYYAQEAAQDLQSPEESPQKPLESPQEKPQEKLEDSPGLISSYYEQRAAPDLQSP